jgi:uncharacterized membrane protein (UPF0127 family)
MKGDRVLASLEVAASVRDRALGLLGRDGIEGAVLLERTRAVHTIGMRFSIDAAFCAPRASEGGPERLAILEIVTMAPNRLGRLRPRARCVIEAEEGSFERWGLRAGDVVEVMR